MDGFLNNLAYAGRVLASMLSLLIFLPGNYGMSALAVGQRFDKRAFLINSVIFFFNTLLQRPLLTYASYAGFLTTMVSVLLTARFSFGIRGLKCLFAGFKIFVTNMAVEAVCACLVQAIMALNLPIDMLFLYGAKALVNPVNTLFTSSLTALGEGIVCGVMLLARRIRKPQSSPAALHRRLYARVYIRLAGLILLSAGTVWVALSAFFEGWQTASFLENYRVYVPLTAMASGLLVVAASYFMQDLKYISQLQRNDTLERQQAISRSLLANLRFFRHNMINMLYGFEGAIISGDTERLRAYYREMTEKCALVNNENIVALERVPNPAVSAVLLHAVDRAREAALPLNLYVQDGVQFSRSMKDSDLCQVLGVLLDNAIEAALEASERFVSVELRNVEDALEILVQNTYAGAVSTGVLCAGGVSGKPGHTGDGLSSCYGILARQRAAFLNFDVSAQYVRAQLLIRL